MVPIFTLGDTLRDRCWLGKRVLVYVCTTLHSTVLAWQVWEKMQEKMQEIGRQSKGLKKMLGDWAKGVGTEHNRRILEVREGCVCVSTVQGRGLKCPGSQLSGVLQLSGVWIVLV